MEFTVFKDTLFDLINECDAFDIENIQTFDRENRYIVVMQGGQIFELRLRELTGPGSSSDSESSHRQMER